MKVFIYSFPGRFNISNQVLRRVKELLRDVEIETHASATPRSMISVLSKIEKFHPDFIIGLGSYRKNAKNLRFETVFTNHYGKKAISIDGQKTYSVPSPTQLPGHFSIGENAGNSNCNFSGYSILKRLDETGLKSKFAFIHIPGSFGTEEAANYIFDLLHSFH